MNGRTGLRRWIDLGLETLSGAFHDSARRRRTGRGSRPTAHLRSRAARLEVEWLESKLALAPIAAGVTLGAGVADGATRAEAQQASGIVRVSGEVGNTVFVSFVGTTGGVGDAAKIVSKSVAGVGTGVPLAVTLTDADLTRITDGLVYAVVVQRDSMGVFGPNTVVPFTLDTVSPAAVATLLGPGVADGVTRAEATQPGGIMTVSGESTATVYVTFVGTTGGVGDPAKTVTKSVTGLGAITLTDADLARLTDGLVYAVAIQRDAAGNWGPNAVVPLSLDTAAPAAVPTLLGPGVADGAASAEATQASGVVVVSGENGATVYVSFVGTTNGVGDAAKIVTKSVTGRGPGVFTGVTLTAADLVTLTNGPVYAVAIQQDAAGNWGPNEVTPFNLVGVVMDFVRVGDAGNARDPITGRGEVGYAYRMGKYEVTIDQYTTFLNAVAKTDTYGLYNVSMGIDLNVAGISRSGSPGSYSYTVMNNGGPSGNRPITYVSWFDAARFANWMHNGQPSGTQAAATTESGAYTLNGATSGIAPPRNFGARFSLPTQDEWYKAAYYKGGSTIAGYWGYAARSDVAPDNTIGAALNRANYYAGDYAVTQAAAYSANQNYLTDVGACTNSVSSYGTFDQGGNVREWNELDGVAEAVRGLRGGAWHDLLVELSRLGQRVNDTSGETNVIGFRLASPV